MSISQPFHPNQRLDVYLGNMVANRHCEMDRSAAADGVVKLVCGCPQGHLASVLLTVGDDDGYAGTRIRQIEEAFTCC